MIHRFEDWSARLGDALAAAADADMPFEYGKHDCFLVVCDAVLAITGIDLAADFRGYVGDAGVQRLLADNGGVAGIAEAMTAKHGIPEIPPGLAQRGDLVIILDDKGRETFAIVDLTGAKVCALTYAGGWATRPVACIERAWRIG